MELFTEAALTVVEIEARDGYIRPKIKARKIIRSFDTKILMPIQIKVKLEGSFALHHIYSFYIFRKLYFIYIYKVKVNGTSYYCFF